MKACQLVFQPVQVVERRRESVTKGRHGSHGTPSSVGRRLIPGSRNPVWTPVRSDDGFTVWSTTDNAWDGRPRPPSDKALRGGATPGCRCSAPPPSAGLAYPLQEARLRLPAGARTVGLARRASRRLRPCPAERPCPGRLRLGETLEPIARAAAGCRRAWWVGGSSPVCREAAWPSVGRTVSPVKARSLPRTTRTHRGRRTRRERQIGGHRRAIAPLWTSRIENGLWPGMHMNPSPGVQSHLDLQQGRPGEGTPAAAEAVGQAVVLPVPSRPFEPAEEVPTRPW